MRDVADVWTQHLFEPLELATSSKRWAFAECAPALVDLLVGDCRAFKDGVERDGSSADVDARR